MDIILDYLPYLATGFAVTLGCAAGALLLAVVLGGALGTLDYANPSWSVRWAIRAFVGLFRNTPFLVQLYIWYFGLPYIGIQLSPLAAGIAGLGLYGASYVTEIVRGSMAAVGREQEEAGLSAGLSRWDVTFRIVWPQAFSGMIPALTNEMVALIKNTSLLGFITITELTLRTQQAISSTFASLPLYLAAGAMYLVVNVALTALARRLETRLASTGRGSAMKATQREEVSIGA